MTALLEEKSQAEARASELEGHVTEMAAVVHAAHLEADQLKIDLKNQQTLPDDAAHDLAQGADGTHGGSIHVLPTVTPDGDRSKTWMASTRQGESDAKTGDLCGPRNLVTQNAWGGEEEGKEKGAETKTAAYAKHGQATSSPSASRLSDAEERVASGEKALLEARNSSHAATEQVKFLEQQLDNARVATVAEAEGKRVAHARIAKLERDIHVMGQEQEVIRARAEARLEALRAAFEQEELEAGGKVNTHDALLDVSRALGCFSHADQHGFRRMRISYVRRRSRGAQEAGGSLEEGAHAGAKCLIFENHNFPVET